MSPMVRPIDRRVDEEQAQARRVALIRLISAAGCRSTRRELDEIASRNSCVATVGRSARCAWTTNATPAVSSRPANIQMKAWLRNALDERGAGRTPSCDGDAAIAVRVMACSSRWVVGLTAGTVDRSGERPSVRAGPACVPRPVRPPARGPRAGRRGGSGTVADGLPGSIPRARA